MKCATHQIEEDQSEDCLTVNIWVQKEVLLGKIWKDQVPIVYYIHGGGFNHGSNQADFFELVKRNWLRIMTVLLEIYFFHFSTILANQLWSFLSLIV